MAKAAAQLRAALGIGSKPAGYPANVDALIEFGAASSFHAVTKFRAQF
jgi:hypothetical protein